MDRDAIRRHIEFKRSGRELREEVAVRMLSQLGRLGGDEKVDYAVLLESAMFLPLPRRCYHTAPVAVRDLIRQHGLLAGDPRAGTWSDVGAGFGPVGVYVGAVPDEIGRWAHCYPEWDIWEVDTSALDEASWSHDRLNGPWADAWVLHSNVPAKRITLWGTRDASDSPSIQDVA